MAQYFRLYGDYETLSNGDIADALIDLSGECEGGLGKEGVKNFGGGGGVGGSWCGYKGYLV